VDVLKSFQKLLSKPGKGGTVDTAKALLADGAGADEPVFLPPGVLSQLALSDLPPDTSVQIGVQEDGVMVLEWSGRIFREGDQIVGEADYGRGSIGTFQLGLSSISTSYVGR